MKSHLQKNIAHKIYAAISITFCMSVLPASGALTLANTPLYASVGTVPPNLVVSIDGSGSMVFNYVPDAVGDYASSKRFKSSYFNALYYNPSTTYAIPPKHDGSLFTAPTYTAAYRNGFKQIGSVDLSRAYQAEKYFLPTPGSTTPADYAGTPVYASGDAKKTYTCTATFDRNGGGTGRGALIVSSCTGGTNNSAPFSEISVGANLNIAGSTDPGDYTVRSISSNTQIVLNENFSADRSNRTNITLSWSGPAYYYRFWNDGKTPAAATSRPADCDATSANQKTDDDCYVLVWVGSSTDITAGSTAAAKQQNFANWYSFYRSRSLAAASGAMQAFSRVDPNVRLAWQGIHNTGTNNCGTFGTSCKGSDGTSYDSRMRALGETLSNNKTHKQEFYEWLANQPLFGGTPTIAAVDRAGRYFQLSAATPAADHPLAETPPTRAGTFRSCRINYSLLITDGGWCADTSSSTTIGDDNSATITLPVAAPIGNGGASTTSWTPGAPYRDGQGYNLADIAFYFWRTPMKSGITYNVPQRISDPTGTAKDQWLNPRNDPATWLHLNSFTIGLGMNNTMTGVRVDGGSTTGWASGGSLPVWGGSTFAGDYSKLLLGTGCPTTTTQAGSAPSPYCWPATKKEESCSISTFAPVSQQYKVYDMWHSAIASRGQFFSADSPQEITDALTAVLAQVQETHGSAAALASNSTSLNTSTMVFQAKMDTTSWYGKLMGLPVNLDGTAASPAWDAASHIPTASARKVFTYPGAGASPSGVEFKGDSNCTSNFSTTQQALLNADGNNVTDNRCTDRVNWLRGDHSKEARNGGSFRNRRTARFMDEADFDKDGNRTENLDIEWVLGDIVNSDPVFVRNQNLGYSTSGSGLPESQKSAYLSFLSSKTNRTPMLYVGANDGMLHAFNATLDTNTNGGKEVFAYVPAGVYENLSKLTEQSYSHRYYVDGSPTVGDAFIDGEWKTVLVGGLNAGGKSIYALNVTDPDNFNASNVLWEFTDTDLGYTFSQPRIARLNNGTWAAIFGNGYNSASDKAFLYIVNLETGVLIKKIATSNATNNGLSTPAFYDSNGDRIVDKVYAGDLQGNLWKFDLSSSISDEWSLGNGSSPLYSAGNTHPITTGVALGTHSLGGVMVYFGTGRYLTTSDTEDETLQRFHGIWDKDTSSDTGTVSASSLVAQTISSTTSSGGFEWRVTSNNLVDYSSTGNKRGWYMEFTPVPGERILSTPQLKYGRVIFTTVIPSTDPCTPGGTSWLMELDATSGGFITEPVFDMDGNKVIDSNDKISGVPPSGIKLTVGAARPPVWLSARSISTTGIPGTDSQSLGDSLGGLTTGSSANDGGTIVIPACTADCTTTKMLSGTAGTIQSIQNREPADTVTPPTSTGSKKRVYWRQLQ